jgi:NAD(P)-dependent dehydrogenase (short-subunit alcohol dehydrogenase family)
MSDQQRPVIVVTGGGSGIGRACAEELARQGGIVILAEADPVAGRDTEATLQQVGHSVSYLPVDVTSEESVRRGFAEIAARFGFISVLVNNVGHYEELSLEEMSLEEWNSALQLNLASVFLCSKYALPLLEKSPFQKVIVNLSSNLATIAEPRAPAYCSAKAAVNMLTKCLALEYARRDIRVVAVAPGPTGRSELSEIPADAEEIEFSRFNPLGRFATPEEVARLIAFVASPAAAYMTGSIVALDGGETANPVSWSILKRVKEEGQV